MSGRRVRHDSLRSVIPTHDSETQRADRQLANRQIDPDAIRQDGYELVSTVGIPGTDVVTLVDTFKRIDDGAKS